jgi:signal transduction histidine kinase
MSGRVEPRRGRPRVMLPGGQFWRDALFCLLMLPVGIAGFVWVMSTLVAGLAMGVTVIGLPVAAASLAGARGYTRMVRGMARRLLRINVADPTPPNAKPGLIGWTWAQLSDLVGWRAALYMLLAFPTGIAGFVVTLVVTIIGVVLLPVFVVAGITVRAFAAFHALQVQALLAPTEATERIRRLEQTRSQTVDESAARLRQIERDLHDGAQARMVSLAMNLGMAKERLNQTNDTDDPATARARELLDQAHRDAKAAITELRDLARGIHPAALDTGLEAALATLTARSPIPTNLTVHLPTRPTPAIETITYFCAAELLTNTIKYSGAASVSMELTREGDQLMLAVSDDGTGGARITAGGGLAGLLDRVRSVDGTLDVESPVGGPTLVTVVLPMHSKPVRH